MRVTSGGPYEIGLPDGGELSGEEAGAGTPVVLIHGFSFDMSLWDPQFQELIQHHRTIRYSLRGFGDSSAPVAEIPGARRQEYPDAGHLLNLERPTRFNEDLLRFLA
jgi:pimeloyl-ACP methyl ester carboxylesterase